LTVEKPLEPKATTIVANGTGKSADPTAIRPALAQLAAENLDGLQRALLDAALSATTRWATVACGGCGARSRVELPVPDVRSRLQAIETLLAQGLGRPGQAEEQPAPRLPTNAAAVKGGRRCRRCSRRATSTRSQRRSGGKALLRERLAPLSDGERCVLREALDALAA
jgi:hypothetical protein